MFDDIEKNRIARLLYYILLVASGFIVVLILGFVIAGATDIWFIAPPVASLVLYVGTYALLKAGKVRLSGIIYVLLGYLTITTVVFLYGGINTPFAILYVGTMIFAGVLLDTPLTIGTLILVMATAVGFYVAEQHGLVPKTAQMLPITPAIILASTALTTFVVLLISNQSYRQAVRRSQDSEAKLLVLNEELEQKVASRTSELKQAKEDAEAARDRALEADRIKSQFLASMSHELRTPLNAILNFSKLMRKGMLGPVNERQEDTLNEVVASGQHLLNLINDVLDISKMQSSMLALFVEENIDLYPILDAASTTTEALIKDKPVTLTRDIDSGLPPILGDRRRVQQVLLNLLSNAAKFTDQGTITLSVKRKGDKILFAIMDTGVGIPKEQHEIIFEPFVQTESGIKHAGGTGLGLPIAKNLVETHDGEIWLESTPGKGSAFKFALPIESPRLRQQLQSSMEPAHA